MDLLEAALERKRQKIRRMEESLRARQVALGEKVKELDMRMIKKQHLLSKKAAGQKLVDDFMVFIEADQKNRGKNAQEFDEKAMMQSIQTMMKKNAQDFDEKAMMQAIQTMMKNAQYVDEKAMMQAIQTMMISENGGGFAADYGDTVLKTGVTEATKNSNDGFGDNYGGFAGGKGGVNNAAPETAQNLGKQATIAAVKETKNDGSTDDGGDAGGCGGSDK